MEGSKTSMRQRQETKTTAEEEEKEGGKRGEGGEVKL